MLLDLAEFQPYLDVDVPEVVHSGEGLGHFGHVPAVVNNNAIHFVEDDPAVLAPRPGAPLLELVIEIVKLEARDVPVDDVAFVAFPWPELCVFLLLVGVLVIGGDGQSEQTVEVSALLDALLRQHLVAGDDIYGVPL